MQGKGARGGIRVLMDCGSSLVDEGLDGCDGMPD